MRGLSVLSGCEAAKGLDAVEEPLDQGALPIDTVAGVGRLPSGRCSPRLGGTAQRRGVCVLGLAGREGRAFHETSDPRQRLWSVSCLSGCEGETDVSISCVARRMYLGRQAANGTSRASMPTFLRATPCGWTCPQAGAVITMPRSQASETASRMRLHIPAARHRT